MTTWALTAAAPSNAVPGVQWTEYRRTIEAVSVVPRLNLLRRRTAMTGWDPADRPHRDLIRSDEEIELI